MCTLGGNLSYKIFDINMLLFLVCLHGEYQSKHNFVEIPRKFIIAWLSIRKLESSSVLTIMTIIIISTDENLSLRIESYVIYKFTLCFHKIIL